MGAVCNVDPAALHPAVLALPAVTHVRGRLQDPAAATALAAWHAAGGGGGVELLVCDMCGDPVETAAVLRPALPLLRVGGLLVFTLKCAARGAAGVRAQTAAAVAALQAGPLEVAAGGAGV